MLFADLKGSMELLAERDPEEARKLLDPVLTHMMEAVHHYEGTVNQVAGDGIMALFGAPLTHEDHAVRACYAALRMQQRVKRHAEGVFSAYGLNLQIRVGLNSGEVVVGAIGNDLRMDYTAIGRTTHLAARMEQLARPGSILVTPSTLALAEGFVAVSSLGNVPIKGLAEPLEVHEVTGVGPARTRLEAVARRGLTRFVGRDIELEELRRAQQLACGGHGQVMAIVADAGMGKSRLVHELTHAQSLDRRLVLECAAVPYGRLMGYLPVINLLRSYFGIHDKDSLGAIRDKIAGKLAGLDPGLESTLPALLALLDVPNADAAWQMLGAAERRRRMLDAVQRLLLREAQHQPILLVFEDLHWIDSETQALLDAIVESISSARILLLLNYRPEYQHGWVGKAYYGQIRLEALLPESAEELLDALLGNDPALNPLKQLLAKLSNPFFLEEAVRTLVETKALKGRPGQYHPTRAVETIQIPATVQVVLAARIDRLAQEDKRLLQTASVVGKNVPFALLQAIAELPDHALRRGLANLRAAAFIDEIGPFPNREYTFKHALTHEVAYGGLLLDHRRHLHARIVDAIETLHRDRLDEQIEHLAHHAFQGELRAKAVGYLRRSGLKAVARSALLQARVWFEEALGVLDALPESPATLETGFDIRLELRPVLTVLGEIPQVVQRLGEAAVLAEQLNDDRRRGQVFGLSINAHTLLGEFDEALAAGARALEIAERIRDLRLRFVSMHFVEQTHYYRGDYERAIELATVSLAAMPTEWAHEHFGLLAPASVFHLGWLFLSLGELGRFTEAVPRVDEAFQLAGPTHYAWAFGRLHFQAGYLWLLKGDWAQARARFEHSVAAYRMGNVRLELPDVVAHSAWALSQLGEQSEALSRIHEAEKLAAPFAAKGIAMVSRTYHALGRACLALGRLDEAQRLGKCACDFAPGGDRTNAHVVHLLGDIATHPGQFDADNGKTLYRQALALAEPRGMRPLIAHCHLGLGKLYQRAGEQEQAGEHFTTASTLYREMDMAFWLAQVGTKRH